VKVGVLALQGGFDAHARALLSLAIDPVLVRVPSDLAALDGLVMGGGESTTHLLLLESTELDAAITTFARERPVLATCAGLVLIARRVRPAQRSLGLLDVEVERNAWGRQLASFEATADDGRTPLVMIRAPRIVELGRGVEVAASFRGEPILVRRGAIWGATFHPELTSDRSIHRRVFAPAG
jgi:5'-phosphate synthase pdxT subunit